jgi:hypothetical protein
VSAHTEPSGSTESTGTSPEVIEADIAQQREQLAETIDALTAKLDVKSQAKAKVADVRDRATTETGKPRPELLVGAGVLVAVVVGVIVWRHHR